MGKHKRDALRTGILTTLRANLNQLMMNKGWTNKDLSDYTGISLSDLTKYRNVEYDILPRVTEIARMCQVFGVSLDFMVGLDPSGRYASLPEEDSTLLTLYKSASDRDKLLILTILGKYDHKDNSETES